MYLILSLFLISLILINTRTFVSIDGDCDRDTRGSIRIVHPRSSVEESEIARKPSDVVLLRSRGLEGPFSDTTSPNQSIGWRVELRGNLCESGSAVCGVDAPSEPSCWILSNSDDNLRVSRSFKNSILFTDGIQINLEGDIFVIGSIVRFHQVGNINLFQKTHLISSANRALLVFAADTYAVQSNASYSYQSSKN